MKEDALPVQTRSGYRIGVLEMGCTCGVGKLEYAIGSECGRGVDMDEMEGGAGRSTCRYADTEWHFIAPKGRLYASPGQRPRSDSINHKP